MNGSSDFRLRGLKSSCVSLLFTIGNWVNTQKYFKKETRLLNAVLQLALLMPALSDRKHRLRVDSKNSHLKAYNPISYCRQGGTFNDIHRNSFQQNSLNILTTLASLHAQEQESR